MKLLGLLMLPLSLFAAESGVQQKLIGAWDLVSYELQTTSGQTSRPLGDNPVGRISYDAAGRMSAHLMKRGVARFASVKREDATEPEIAAAWRGYVGYFGSYTIDEKARAITHHVEGAWYPNYVGSKQVRAYRLQGDHLILNAESASGRTTVTWKRAK
jgi:Lipocalin-like domain